ncbi:MAG TPA: DUF4163 domain-containing protein [Candidatus Udaeobacter sp.]|nr:DUF4163 domain-containing protein [Candidatus Udaeobacter sp.]
MTSRIILYNKYLTKTIIVLVFSLILIVLGLIFGIKYFLKSQSTSLLIPNKSASLSEPEPKTQTTSISNIDTTLSTTSSPEYLLDQMFAKDHWFSRSTEGEGVIIRNGNVKIIEKTISASSSQLRYNVTLKYPQFSGFSNAANEEELNRRIENEVNKRLKDFKDMVKSRASDKIMSGWEKNSHNNFFLAWDIYVSKKDLVSMRLILTTAFETMKGIEVEVKPLIYDAVSGQELALKDFFIPGSDYESRINNIISKRNADLYNNYQVGFNGCLMTERGVMCGKQNFEAGGGSSIRFSVEWKDLEDILNLELVNRLRE